MDRLPAWAKRTGKRALRLIPHIDHLYRQVERLWFPPGHFYSPLPDLEAVRRREHVIFDVQRRALPAIDLSEKGQLRQLEALTPFVKEQPFSTTLGDGRRFHYGNGKYDYADALLTYAMIRWGQPSRIVEVGSGHSSCLILDTVSEFVRHDVDCTFIDPYPEALRGLLRPDDERRIEILARPLQEVDLPDLLRLGAGDILFIDSSHVSKVDSDVNYLFFEVLPNLAPGVLIHVHDVFFPFEYRKDWVYEGRAWNEVYVLRAFLEYNRAFKVLLFVDYLRLFHWDALSPFFPAWWGVTGWGLGSSLWLQKVRE